MVSLLGMWCLTGLRCDRESIALHHSWAGLQLKSDLCGCRITGSPGSPSFAQMSSRAEVVNSVID